MENQDLINQVQEMFTDLASIIDVPAIQSNRVDVYIKAEDLLIATEKLRTNDWGYLITISAYDTIDDAGNPQIGLIYHFGEEGVICSLRLFLPHSERVIESILPNNTFRNSL